ncbi:Protein YOP1 [Mycena kentingensis (nom. inval.)]|nr:Protein YOP1 [Mycena kentingensis (nom. inval.)]
MLAFGVHLVAAWFCFLLPVFGTFKALSHKPISETDIERYAKYWSVLGASISCSLAQVDYGLPFYGEIKLLFLLFLALPQTQGSTYVYDSFLAPYLSANEAVLDADIISIQRNVFNFLQTHLTRLWQMAQSALNKNAAARQQAAATPGAASTAGLDINAALGMFRSLAPSLLSSFQPAAAAGPAAAPTVSAPPTPSASTTSVQVPAASPRTSAAYDAEPSFPEPQHAS